MMDDGDLPMKPSATVITPGEDLSALSLEDLAERRSLIESEIARIDAMVTSKKAGRETAESVFRTG
jgi:uncharacterized small protein (DUF1192 family)|tara:strand:+ start:832 stop:1029 length:198 start_codon:yes stop_codon:yes gene_type:complete